MNRIAIKFSALFCFSFFILISALYAQENSLVTRIKEIENLLPAIIESNNVEALDSMLHSEFTVQSSEGTLIRKAQLLNGFRSGQNPYNKFRPHANSVVIVNENTVITSGNETYSHKDDNEPGKEHTRFYYHVWVKKDENWHLAGRVIAPLPIK